MAGNSYTRTQWRLNHLIGKYDLIILADGQYGTWDALCLRYGVFARRKGVWPITVDLGKLCAVAHDEGKAIAVVLFKEDYSDPNEWDLKFYFLTDVYEATFYYFGYD